MVIYDRARSTLCDLPFLKPNYRDAPFSPTPARDTSGINDEADTEVSEDDDDDGMIEEREAQPLVQDVSSLPRIVLCSEPLTTDTREDTSTLTLPQLRTDFAA